MAIQLGMVDTRKSVGAMIVGASAWVLYFMLVYASVGLFHMHHTLAELLWIVPSWVYTYTLQTTLVYHKPLSVLRFLSFCSVSTIGWVFFLAVAVVAFNFIPLPIAHFLSVAGKTVSNVILQQIVTFGLKFRNSEELK